MQKGLGRRGCREQGYSKFVPCLEDASFDGPWVHQERQDVRNDFRRQSRLFSHLEKVVVVLVMVEVDGRGRMPVAQFLLFYGQRSLDMMKRRIVIWAPPKRL